MTGIPLKALIKQESESVQRISLAGPILSDQSVDTLSEAELRFHEIPKVAYTEFSDVHDAMPSAKSLLPTAVAVAREAVPESHRKPAAWSPLRPCQLCRSEPDYSQQWSRRPCHGPSRPYVFGAYALFPCH